MNGRGMYEHTTFSTSDFYFFLVIDNGNTRKISETTEIPYSSLLFPFFSVYFSFFPLLIIQ